jgi:hypothetical protein
MTDAKAATIFFLELFFFDHCGPNYCHAGSSGYLCVRSGGSRKNQIVDR